MIQNDADTNNSGINRREFLRGASFGGMMLVASGSTLLAQDKTAAAGAPEETHYSTKVKPVSCGVIGCGVWGREVLQTLAVLPNAPVVAICDNYKKALDRGAKFAPSAQAYDDYKKLLAQKDVEAVIIATPSHQHKEIVLAALAAGKHVYCEVPLAHTVEDAREIAKAAKAAFKVNFQSGLQSRSDPRKLYVMKEFVRPGALGKKLLARSQSHRSESWGLPTSPERDKEVNWRLHRETSPGLMGEIGVHQLDLMSWFLNGRPTAVTGFGGLLRWTEDGRDVPDTVQAVFEFPEKVNYMYDATLGNSFEGDQDTLFGSFGAVLMRGEKGWLFKEAAADLFSWEIYASKEKFQKETGIVLAADATKSVKVAAVPTAADAYKDSALNAALESFVTNSVEVRDGVKGFIDSYGEDDEAEFRRTLADNVKKRVPENRAAGWKEGFEATVCALKANEAVLKGQKIMLTKDLFEI